MPLTLRTYWRAAAAISSAVAGGSSPRSSVMFRHMDSTIGAGSPASRRERNATAKSGSIFGSGVTLARPHYGDLMTDEILLIETDERVRALTLNRPQSRNALSGALRDQFFGALGDAETDDDVDVVILTGADPVFCAGLDLKELGGQSALPDISPRWPPMTKPVIGAINGAAVTGGLELVLYCDIVIASEQARFADTHARVGLLPTWGLSVAH